jgi:TM2 domain-containing membrane protein YozV
MAIERKKLNVLLLCCLGFVGLAGIHRFYAGKVGTGIIWILTGGICGVGTIIDLIVIITDNFADSDGKKIQGWD